MIIFLLKSFLFLIVCFVIISSVKIVHGTLIACLVIPAIIFTLLEIMLVFKTFISLYKAKKTTDAALSQAKDYTAALTALVPKENK